MFCSLILRIRRISICNNFEKFPSICIEKAREERTPFCTSLTVKVTSIAIGNSQKSDWLFLACRHEKLWLSILVSVLLGFRKHKRFREPRKLACVRKEPWDHVTVLCFLSTTFPYTVFPLATNMLRTICDFEFYSAIPF